MRETAWATFRKPDSPGTILCNSQQRPFYVQVEALNSYTSKCHWPGRGLSYFAEHYFEAADSSHLQASGPGILGYGMRSAPEKPLSALLSQILIAYTVELDGVFEHRMLQTQEGGARLSLVTWLNLLRFLAVEPVSVRTLASRALVAGEQVDLSLGCFERWGFIRCNPEAPRFR